MNNKTNWIKIKTSKFFTFYSLNKDIDNKDYYKKCDQHVKTLCKTFEFNINKIENIKYYILPNIKQYKAILGRKSYGEIRNNCIYSVHEYHPHEITHIIMHKFLGNGRIKIFSEGIAVLYGWNNNGPIWRSKPLKYWLKKYRKKINLKQLIVNFKSIDTKISYPISAIFIDFFIKNFGINKFKKAYRNLKNNLSLKDQNEILKKITNKPYKELINDFYVYYNLK